MDNNNANDIITVPSHLCETLRYKTYVWNKKADILRLANQIVQNKSDDVTFLGYPLE